MSKTPEQELMELVKEWGDKPDRKEDGDLAVLVVRAIRELQTTDTRLTGSIEGLANKMAGEMQQLTKEVRDLRKKIEKLEKAKG